MYISHPQLVPDSVEERKYQVNISNDCKRSDTLVILPTGMGKTIVALLTAADFLERGKRVLLLAPTKPLVDQHAKSFASMLSKASVGTMNGNMPPESRVKVMCSHNVIVSTPQAVANDLRNSVYTLDDFDLVIYDEAHRAVGNYAYVEVASYRNGRSMGMTASPGSDIKRIEEVCDNLSLSRIAIRSEDDPDVSPYVHDIYLKEVHVELPQELSDMVYVMQKILDEYVRELVRLKIMDPNWPASTKHMLMIGNSLAMRLKRGERTNIVFRGMTVQSICIKLLHAIGLAESQGVTTLKKYLQKIYDGADGKKGKADKELIARPDFRSLINMVMESKIEHPKISRLMGLVSKELNSKETPKILVFSHYRETCDMLVEKLSMIDGAKVGKLVGQSNGGLKQKEQIGLLDAFRQGEYNVIISTSVGEEGLDIASTDMVIFYEPVPSEIRTIQRRGRTGRKNDGEVYVLITRGTRDEVFENTSNKKEKLMRTRLERLSSELETRHPSQRSFSDFQN